MTSGEERQSVNRDFVRDDHRVSGPTLSDGRSLIETERRLHVVERSVFHRYRDVSQHPTHVSGEVLAGVLDHASKAPSRASDPALTLRMWDSQRGHCLSPG